jgi:hypothetical protein
MINAEVIKGVKELLEERGVAQKSGERFSDFVARGLGISAGQTELLLESLHDGHTVDEAMRAAGLTSADVNGDLLMQVARAIGAALGRVTPKS